MVNVIVQSGILVVLPPMSPSLDHLPDDMFTSNETTIRTNSTTGNGNHLRKMRI